MLSIDPFVQSQRNRRTDSLNRVISVLQGVALTSRGQDEGECEAFEHTLRRLREDFRRVDDEDSALLLAGSAIRALEEHWRAVERATAIRQNEMEAAILRISDLLLTVAHASEEQALELRETEHDIWSSRQSDIAGARAHLAACLENIRIHAQRKNEAAPMPLQSRSEGEMDAVTGPPDSRQA